MEEKRFYLINILLKLQYLLNDKICISRNSDPLVRPDGGDIDFFVRRKDFSRILKFFKELESEDSFKIEIIYFSRTCLSLGLNFYNWRYLCLEFFAGVSHRSIPLISFENLEFGIEKQSQLNVLNKSLQYLLADLHYSFNYSRKYERDLIENWNTSLINELCDNLKIPIPESYYDFRNHFRERINKVGFLQRSLYRILNLVEVLLKSRLFSGRIIYVADESMQNKIFSTIEDYHLLTPNRRKLSSRFDFKDAFLAYLFGSIYLYSGKYRMGRRVNNEEELWR